MEQVVCRMSKAQVLKFIFLPSTYDIRSAVFAYSALDILKKCDKTYALNVAAGPF